MFYLDVVLKSFAIAALLTFMIIAIWGFVVFNSIYSQLKYTNYILEKISHILNISCTESYDKRKANKNTAADLIEVTENETSTAEEGQGD